MAREPDAIKKTELQIPAARGMFAPHLKCLHLYPCWLGITFYGANTGNVSPAPLVGCMSSWAYMIPIVFAARAVSPQMMCTIPTTAATCLMRTIVHKAEHNDKGDDDRSDDDGNFCLLILVKWLEWRPLQNTPGWTSASQAFHPSYSHSRKPHGLDHPHPYPSLLLPLFTMEQTRTILDWWVRLGLSSWARSSCYLLLTHLWSCFLTGGVVAGARWADWSQLLLARSA